ncbi:hypothetical protein E2562_007428 [Oryza meyeriana var. granulata]|uniref:Uncharacterized protein n=1 Tax=Oryza meyeriana var. granulata TaxID=110450 RepID=A0A6G1CYD5_9ORYZ|nr:hypothetical protein E2562_007428 [Oryza meyeriana var. granulata]
MLRAVANACRSGVATPSLIRNAIAMDRAAWSSSAANPSAAANVNHDGLGKLRRAPMFDRWTLLRQTSSPKLPTFAAERAKASSTASLDFKAAYFARNRGRGVSSLPSGDEDVVKGVAGAGAVDGDVAAAAGGSEEKKDGSRKRRSAAAAAGAMSEEKKDEVRKTKSAAAVVVEKVKEVLVRLLRGLAISFFMAIASLARILLGPESSRAHVAIALAWSSMVKIWVGDARVQLDKWPAPSKPELAKGGAVGAEGRSSHEDIVLKQMQLQFTELRVWIKEERRKDDRKAKQKIRWQPTSNQLEDVVKRERQQRIDSCLLACDVGLVLELLQPPLSHILRCPDEYLHQLLTSLLLVLLIGGLVVLGEDLEEAPLVTYPTIEHQLGHDEERRASMLPFCHSSYAPP